jgi:hypothetical protein
MYRGWSRSLGARVAARGRDSAAGEISETFAMRCVLMGISLHTPGFGKLQDVCRKHPVCALVRGITWLRLRALGSRTETGAAAARKLGRSCVSVGNSQALPRNTRRIQSSLLELLEHYWTE